MVYYLILAYNKEVDNERQTHLHPTYLTCFKMDGKQLMLQTGLYDALKFVNADTAKEWVALAEPVFPQKEFQVVMFPKDVFGRVTPRFVVNDEFDPTCNFDIMCESDNGNERFVLNATVMERAAIKKFVREYNKVVPSWQKLDVKMNGVQIE
jgi:hypothetical protein